MSKLNEDFLADFLDDPQKYKKLWFEQAKRENAQWTDQQLENSWQLLVLMTGVE